PCGTSPAQTILWWSRFVQFQVDPAFPFLITLPLEEPWLDVTFGEPGAHEFFCLRASPKAVPLANEVPYNLDAAFRQSAATILAQFQKGQAPPSAAAASNLSAPASSALASTKHKLLKWFGGGAALLAVLILFAFFFFSPWKQYLA